MTLIDTHCHLYLDPLARDIEGVRERAGKVGVAAVVVPTYDRPSWDPVLDLAQQDWIHPALGLHPRYADQAGESPADLARFRDRLATLANAANAVAIGEIGLDFELEEPSHEQQLRVLKIQLELAVDLELPVIIHCRNGWELLVAALQPYAGRIRGVMHAYSRHPELARPFLACGMMVGLGGAITRPQAVRACRSAAELSLEHILLETDAPATGLAGVEPARTEPHHLQEVAEVLARFQDTTPERVAEITTENAREFFHI